MPDPFAPRPCKDCGKDLPHKVLEAHDFLYGGGRIDISSLADDIEESVRRNDRARERSQTAYADVITVGAAISRHFSYSSEDDLAAAVRHYGDMGHPDGSECERIEAAKWCHEQTPDYVGISDPREPTCTLEANHEGEHQFYETAGRLQDARP